VYYVLSCIIIVHVCIMYYVLLNETAKNCYIEESDTTPEIKEAPVVNLLIIISSKKQ
jgi:hypothetical protein